MIVNQQKLLAKNTWPYASEPDQIAGWGEKKNNNSFCISQ